jgi:hypothetical protein
MTGIFNKKLGKLHEDHIIKCSETRRGNDALNLNDDLFFFSYILENLYSSVECVRNVNFIPVINKQT